MPYIGDSPALSLPLRPTDRLLVERDGVSPLEAPVSALLELMPTPTAEQVGAVQPSDLGPLATMTLPEARSAVSEAQNIGISGSPESGYTYTFGGYHYKKDTATSCFVAGGTMSQPNYLGKRFSRHLIAGDGVTVAHTVTPGFVLPDPGDRVAVRATSTRALDGAHTVYDPATAFTVSGYGTSTLTVTFPAPIASGVELEITVISIDDDAAANPKLNALVGYDNVSNGIMSNVFGAHCFNYSGEGHNTIAGGSFHRVAGQYNTILGGKNVVVGLRNPAGTTGASAAGASVRVDGYASFGYGANLDINAAGAGYLGRNGEAKFTDTLGFLWGAKPRSKSEVAIGCGRAGDGVAWGMRQHRIALRSYDTTSSAATYLTDSEGSSEILIEQNTSALVRVRVTAKLLDLSKSISYEGTYHVSRVGSAAPTVNGSASDVLITAVGNIGAPTWTVALRGITAGLRVRAYGDASATVRWMAVVEITEAV